MIAKPLNAKTYVKTEKFIKMKDASLLLQQGHFQTQKFYNSGH
jgi:hypothetical protein